MQQQIIPVMPRKAYVEAVPNLAVTSTVISAATVGFTYPQVVAVSNGLLPKPSVSSMVGVFSRALGFQILGKYIQLSLMRHVKLELDEWSPNTKPLNTMLSYGSTGVPFQSMLYNQLIGDIYKYHKLSPPTLPGGNFVEKGRALFMAKIYPGLFWCFLRESCATGGALVVGPSLRPHYEEALGHDRPLLARFLSGLTAGFFTAFATQWLHNITLKAGSMSELGERPTTVACFRRAVSDLGVAL
eukprot:Sspe_Gene.72893::Locus_43699_Transcript_1_1_Confidence_1.000_Length_803::g.72893::m.72893